MNTAIIIQARTGSTRLPNKMVIPFNNGMSLIEILLKRINNKYKNKYKIILATTTNVSDNILEIFALKNSIKTYRGSEHNVLNRFIYAAKNNNVKYLVRVCADNPFLDVKHIDEIIKTGISTNSDYVSYNFNDNTPVIKSHLGLYTEFTTLKALQKVQASTSNSIYTEHVTNYIYSNPDIFKIKLLNLNHKLKGRTDLRFTLDTEKDFKNLQKIYNDIGEENISNVEKLIKTVDNNTEYLKVMKSQIEKNSK